jgi:hypothetical protein
MKRERRTTRGTYGSNGAKMSAHRVPGARAATPQQPTARQAENSAKLAAAPDDQNSEYETTWPLTL